MRWSTIEAHSKKIVLEVSFSCLSIYEQHCDIFHAKLSEKEDGVR